MDCPHIPTIGYPQLSEQMNRKNTAKRIPITGSFELTFRCNLRCAHCYCNLPQNDRDAIKKELSTGEVCDILDQIAEAGCLWLLITGGEPLLRKDFLEIYTYAKKKGFIITLFTNGTLMTPEIADYLAEWPPFRVEITLYGATKETYERIAQFPGSFERCIQGIDLLLKRNIALKLKTIVMNLNLKELWDIEKLTERLGVKFGFDPLLTPRLDGSKTPINFRLSPEEVVRLELSREKKVEEWRELFGKSKDFSNINNLYLCGAGISSFHLDPYGQMSMCIMSRFQSYDLPHGSFYKGWQTFFPQYLSQKPKSDYRCNQCELIAVCDQCPGWALLENGNPDSSVEYLCKIAYLRANAFKILNVRNH